MEPQNMINFLLVGVGGQGTILASDVLADLGLRMGYDVKKAEVHGLSQRGGSVISHLRWGKEVFSPIISQGNVDVLIAFEKLEAVRFVNQLRPGGLVLVNDYMITPVTVSAGTAVYPSDVTIQSELQRFTESVHWIKGVEIAETLGNVRTANVVILGALSTVMDLPVDIFSSVIEARVPKKYIALNHEAFEAGREMLRVGV